jgi:hypothetical protein
MILFTRTNAMPVTIYERVFGSVAYEETTQGETLQFPSFIYHSTEEFELVRKLKGFRPILPSKCMTVLLNFQANPEYLGNKSIM